MDELGPAAGSPRLGVASLTDPDLVDRNIDRLNIPPAGVSCLARIVGPCAAPGALSAKRMSPASLTDRGCT